MYAVSTVLLRFQVKFMLCMTVSISWESEMVACAWEHVWLIDSALWFTDSALKNAVYHKWLADSFTESLMIVDDFHKLQVLE